MTGKLRIHRVSFSGETMVVRFSDERKLAVPLSSFPRLQAASAAERKEWVLIGRGLGVHWESVDEDLSVENILLAYSRQRKDVYAQAAG
ncbi:MAG: DUF2442 domain-containing protein [Planctomycetota bacterium]